MNDFQALLLDQLPTKILPKVDLPGIPASFQTDINLVLYILKSYNVRKVILYGSVARGDFRSDSDLDICVEGLSDDVFLSRLLSA